MRTIRVSVVVVFLVALAGAAAAADYWPLTPGTTFTYQDPAWNVDIQEMGPGWFVRNRTSEACSGQDFYRLSEDGDVLWCGYNRICESWVDPSSVEFDPPVLFLDLPLTMYKSWTSQASIGGIAHPESVIYYFIVNGQESVTTPAGTFDTIRIQYFGSGLSVQTLYLHRQLGPVLDVNGSRLSGWTGVVENDLATWGEVKALY
jgi:hypothetical protein